MKHAWQFLTVSAILVLSLVSSARALEPPRIIPHSAQVKEPPDQVFGKLKTYFSDLGLSKFNLVSADEGSGTIVAKQDGVDNARWKQWAACEADPMHMLYQFTDGSVTVTSKVERSGRDSSFVTVSADFQGTYGLAQDQTTIACRSLGALEDNILTVAGAQPAKNQ